LLPIIVGSSFDALIIGDEETRSTWGALVEANYREKLGDLHAELDRLDTAPDERRIMTAIPLAQDLSATWQRPRPERRKQLIAELFELIRIGGGRIRRVRPKPAVMPLVAVTVGWIEGKDWRSRPDSNPEMCTLGGVAIEAIDEYVAILQAAGGAS
jgi:hypothetical protein